MSVLKNKITSQVIEISNSCAELYFDIDEGSKIEYSVSRLKKNSNSLMNQSCLNYLLQYNAIHSDDADNYSMIGRQKVSHFKSYREIPNAILLNFTNYKNKNLFEKWI